MMEKSSFWKRLFSSRSATCATPYTGEPLFSDESLTLDIADYSIVYPASFSETAKEKVKAFADFVGVTCGFTPALVEAEKKVAVKGGKILVGALSHKASKKLRRSLGGHGFAVSVVKNDIVIVGTTALFTTVALDFFAKQYLVGKKEKNTALPLSRDARLVGIPTVSLVEGDSCRYRHVYGAALDDIEGWSHVIPGNHSGGASKDTVDRPVALCKEFSALVKELVPTCLNAEMGKDDTETDCEVLVEVTDRALGRQLLDGLDAAAYALFVRGNKIIVGAWNDEGIEFSAKLYKDALRDSVCGKNIVLPAEYTDCGVMDINWITDFPKPDGTELVGTLSSSHDSLIYCYQGKGITAENFRAYCEKLEKEGYVALQHADIDGNLFATYKNEEANASLNLQYAHQTNDIPCSYYIAKPYVERSVPTFRITSAPLTSVALPTEELLNENSRFTVTKLTDTMITQPCFDYANGDKGLCFIITLEDGTFIIIDGSTNKNAMDDKLWAQLNTLYRHVHGHEATEKGSIHVRAWTMSHEHGDHYGSFLGFLEKYGKNPLFRMDYLLANFTSKTQDYNAMQPSHAVCDRLDLLRSYFPEGEAFEHIKVHTGQRLYLANVMMEVLSTHQDIAPHRQHFFNDTSTVFKITIYNTDGKGGISLNDKGEEAKTVYMSLGDASLYASTYMRSTFTPETLRAELVQIAHHGGFGCENELYDLMAPTATYWNHWIDFVNKMCSPERKDKISLEYPVGYHVMYELEGHKYAYISEGHSTTLTISKNGPLYHELRDAMNDLAPIDYDGEGVVDVAEKRKGITL